MPPWEHFQFVLSSNWKSPGADRFHRSTGVYQFSYIDVPLLVSGKMSPFFTPYGGLILAFNLDSTCTNSKPGMVCNTKDSEKLVIPIRIGFNSELSNALGVSVFYEFTMSGSGPAAELAPDIDNYRAIGANMFYRFE